MEIGLTEQIDHRGLLQRRAELLCARQNQREQLRRVRLQLAPNQRLLLMLLLLLLMMMMLMTMMMMMSSGRLFIVLFMFC